MAFAQQVLTTTVIILFIFLLGSFVRDFWRRSEQDSQYNIGCYVVNHSLNKTESLVHRISDTQHQENINVMKVMALKNDINNTKDYHNKSITLALSFQKYIKEIVEIQEFTYENTLILEQIKKAENQYLSCKRQILGSYSHQDCTDNWMEYKHCSTRMKNARSKIQALANQHASIHQQISEFIRVPNKSISSLDLAKRIYNESMENNEQEKNKLTKRVEQAQKLLRKKIYERDQSSQKYQLSAKNLQQCQQSKKKHRACQQISKEVKKINSQNIAYLQTMMASKEQLLKNLQRIINSQKNSTEMQELNEKYHRHRQEYISMFKEFISLTKQNLKACGCTEQKEKQFKLQIQNLKKRYTQCNKQISEYNKTVIQLNDLLNKKEVQRQEIVKNYKKELEYNENLPHQTETQLSRINKSLQKKQNQIIQMRYTYKSIENECNQIKLRMGRRVKDINKINDCLNKKEFFLQLKHQINKYIHSKPSVNKLEVSKQQLRQYLLNF